MDTKVTRIYTGPDNETHFGEVEPTSEDYKGIARQWQLVKAMGVVLRETPASYTNTWHNAPRRQLVITLKGEWEIEVGDGSKRRFRSGDVLLAEDLMGRGHIARSINGQPRNLLFVHLD